MTTNFCSIHAEIESRIPDLIQIVSYICSDTDCVLYLFKNSRKSDIISIARKKNPELPMLVSKKINSTCPPDLESMLEKNNNTNNNKSPSYQAVIENNHKFSLSTPPKRNNFGKQIYLQFRSQNLQESVIAIRENTSHIYFYFWCNNYVIK